MSESTEAVVLTERRDRVLLITLNRPEAMNAINTDLAQGILAAIAELDGDPGLTAGVLTGAGRGFCAGMDLKAFAAGGTPDGFQQVIEDGAQKPLIAAVEGFALAGGLELALTCDLIVAADNVKFGIPEAGVGLFAAGGGLFRLPPRVGYGKAMEMALTADPISAQEALSLGLAARLTDKGGAVDGRARTGRAHRQERAARGRRVEADHPQLRRTHRGRGLEEPGIADRQGLHVERRHGGTGRVRREARSEVDRDLNG